MMRGSAVVSFRIVSVSRSIDRNQSSMSWVTRPDSSASRSPMPLKMLRTMRWLGGIDGHHTIHPPHAPDAHDQGRLLDRRANREAEQQKLVNAIGMRCSRVKRHVAAEGRCAATCARSSSSASRASTTSASANTSSRSTSSSPPTSGSLSPQPGRSSSTQRNPSSRATSVAQLVPQIDPPCMNRTVGPCPTSWTRTRALVRGRSNHRSVGVTPTEDQRRRSASRYRASSTTSKPARSTGAVVALRGRHRDRRAVTSCYD